MTTPTDPDVDWTPYNRAQTGRSVRALALTALQLAGPGAGRSAVELGSGAGIEARELARHGWRVHTFDADPDSEVAMREAAPEITTVEHTVCRLEELSHVPANDLTLACVSLPFLPRESFDAVWRLAVDALRPGGVLAVDLFGVRDGWAGAGGTFLTRAEVEHLVDCLDVVSLVEVERDGRSFSGRKHWHTYELVARTPGHQDC